MINKIRPFIEHTLSHFKKHRQLQLALLVIVILPLLYVYSANSFLSAGSANQVQLLESSADIIHDSVLVTAQVSNNDPDVLQQQLGLAVARNDDLIQLEILSPVRDYFTIVAASDSDDLGTMITRDDLFTAATQFPGQTLHKLLSTENNYTVLRSVRLVREVGQADFYIVSELSLAQSDVAFAEAAQSAYLVLILIYLIVIAIAIWHVRAISYYDLFSYTYDTLKSRRQFTHMIAHELQSPLTAIRGYSSMLGSHNTLPKDAIEQIEQIQLASDRITESVGSLLDVARIQSGTLSLDITLVDVSALVVVALSKNRPVLIDKPISLVQSGELAGVSVETDKKRLEQILVAVVQQAIDNIESGTVEIDVRSEQNACVLRVKTMGTGLATHDYKKVFAPFFTSPSIKGHETLSSGLKTWIARQYIDLIGARVSVESIEDVGTHVVITIPKEYIKPVV